MPVAPRRPLRWLACAALVLVVAGCRTEVVVGVDVRPDGSGTVTVTASLDAEAATQLGDPAQLSFQDLATAGWTAEPAEEVDGGGLRIRVRRRFASPDELASVLAEVGGRDGVFRDVGLDVTDALASTDYRFRADIRVTGDPAQFGDPDLTAALGGLALGRTPEELAALGTADADAATLTLSVRLPGDAPDTNGTLRSGRAEWTVPLTGGTATSEDARSASSVAKGRTRALLGAAAVLLVLALVVLVVGLVRTRRRRAASAPNPSAPDPSAPNPSA